MFTSLSGNVNAFSNYDGKENAALINKLEKKYDFEIYQKILKNLIKTADEHLKYYKFNSSTYSSQNPKHSTQLITLKSYRDGYTMALEQVKEEMKKLSKEEYAKKEKEAQLNEENRKKFVDALRQQDELFKKISKDLSEAK